MMRDDTTRRQFIKAGAVLGAGLALGRPGVGGAAEAAAPKNALALVHGTDAEAMVRKAFDLLGGLSRFVAPGSRVVVKPNASFANAPEWGNNTRPEIAAAVCKLCREAGARRVVVVDYPLMRGAEAPVINGVQPACEKIGGVKMRVLGAEHQFRAIAIPGATALKDGVAVSRDVLDADLLINVPVAKAHDAVSVSIGLKNLMGVIWDRSAFHTMMDINQAIAELASAVKPGLTLVDMTRVMLTNGPKGPGEVAEPGLVIASTDPVAADALALRQARFNGRKLKATQVRYLRTASELGVGELDVEKLELREASV